MALDGRPRGDYGRPVKRLLLALGFATVLAAPAQGATLLRLDGIGPLRLGMSRTAAVATGWLSNRRAGCPLGGRPYPIEYALDGRSAPPALRGIAEFRGGRLTSVTVTRGARTATGVVPGTTRWPSMVRRYRRAGFRVSARYVTAFGGTFVDVRRRRGDATVLGGFAEKGRPVSVLGIPFVPACD